MYKGILSVTLLYQEGGYATDGMEWIIGKGFVPLGNSPCRREAGILCLPIASCTGTRLYHRSGQPRLKCTADQSQLSEQIVQEEQNQLMKTDIYDLSREGRILYNGIHKMYWSIEPILTGLKPFATPPPLPLRPVRNPMLS